MGDALNQGADTVITVGGRQSNHARLTAAAAARLGLRCELMLTQLVPRHDDDYQYSGNILLDGLFGAIVHDLAGTANALEKANERAALLRAEGRSVYVAPSGGSSPIGCLGYVVCAHEILAQSQEMGVEFDPIIIPNGSSGTHAGLAAGLVALGVSPARVRSFAVLTTEENTRAATIEKAGATLQVLDHQLSIDESEIDVAGSERGPGYGMPTPSMRAALGLMATREGLLLDPVYSGKAFAGLLAMIRNGDCRPGQNILFVMTGGTPALFAYRDELANSRT
jgi:D-cysteine desulfhydrase